MNSLGIKNDEDKSLGLFEKVHGRYRKNRFICIG